MNLPIDPVTQYHDKPLSLLSLIGVLAILAGLITIFYLRHTGWDHPLAKVFGAYKHKIATLSDYVEYKGDANRF